MRAHAACLLVASLALAGCAGETQVDIIELQPAASPLLAGPAPADAIMMDVDVRAGQLRPVLDRGGSVDLLLFDCDAPEGEGEVVPLSFGGEPLAGMAGRQLSDDPDMRVRLNAAVPARAAGLARPCARLVRHPSLMGPEILSRPVPLPRD